MTRTRQPRGIPTGGRFAPQSHAETSLSLSVIDVDEEDLARHDWSDSDFDDEIFLDVDPDDDCCEHCGAPPDEDGDGGLCGDCTDLMFMHEAGEHEFDSRHGCPACG